MPDERYSIIEERGVVSARSIQRLQFDRRGWQVDFVRDLRESLRRLSSRVEHKALRATDASPDEAFVDVENVLLYNVGGASLFGPLPQEGCSVVG